MKILSKEVNFNKTDSDRLYCIKDGETYVFTLYKLEWSIIIHDQTQIENVVEWRECSQDFKNRMLSEMKKIIREFR